MALETRVIAAWMAVPRPAPRHGKKHADHDHGENERVLDERLALLATEPREQMHETGTS